MAGTFKALMLEDSDGKITPSIQEVDETSLPDGDVTVAIDYSDLNFKDGMVIKGLGKLVRQYPHIPGIDFAGTVEQSAHAGFKPGAKVILTGWRVGEVHWGGYAQKARVKGDWLVPLPPQFDTRLAMAMGTAGFTAGMAINTLIAQGATPDKGDLLVTGAAGGVGSVAVALGAKAGYRVVASSGRPETHDYLRELGASDIIDRRELSEGPVRPAGPGAVGRCGRECRIDDPGQGLVANALSRASSPLADWRPGPIFRRLWFHSCCAACG